MIGIAIGTTAKDWTESPDGTRIESPLTRETAVKNKSAPVPIRNASSVMPKILKMNPPKKRSTPLIIKIHSVIQIAKVFLSWIVLSFVTDRNADITNGGVSRKKNFTKSAKQSDRVILTIG